MSAPTDANIVTTVTTSAGTATVGRKERPGERAAVSAENRARGPSVWGEISVPKTADESTQAPADERNGRRRRERCLVRNASTCCIQPHERIAVCLAGSARGYQQAQQQERHSRRGIQTRRGPPSIYRGEVQFVASIQNKRCSSGNIDHHSAKRVEQAAAAVEGVRQKAAETNHHRSVLSSLSLSTMATTGTPPRVAQQHLLPCPQSSRSCLGQPRDASLDVETLSIRSVGIGSPRNEPGRWPHPREAEASPLDFLRIGKACRRSPVPLSPCCLRRQAHWRRQQTPRRRSFGTRIVAKRMVATNTLLCLRVDEKFRDCPNDASQKLADWRDQSPAVTATAAGGGAAKSTTARQGARLPQSGASWWAYRGTNRRRCHNARRTSAIRLSLVLVGLLSLLTPTFGDGNSPRPPLHGQRRLQDAEVISDSPTASISEAPSLADTLPDTASDTDDASPPVTNDTVVPTTLSVSTTAPAVLPKTTAAPSPTQPPNEGPGSIKRSDSPSLVSFSPTAIDTMTSTQLPTATPSQSPSWQPTISTRPSPSPSQLPSTEPTASLSPSAAPTESFQPTLSLQPSLPPTGIPSATPSHAPSSTPSISPTHLPTGQPSAFPTSRPSAAPSASPTQTRIVSTKARLFLTLDGLFRRIDTPEQVALFEQLMNRHTQEYFNTIMAKLPHLASVAVVFVDTQLLRQRFIPKIRQNNVSTSSISTTSGKSTDSDGQSSSISVVTHAKPMHTSSSIDDVDAPQHRQRRHIEMRSLVGGSTERQLQAVLASEAPTISQDTNATETPTALSDTLGATRMPTPSPILSELPSVLPTAAPTTVPSRTPSRAPTAAPTTLVPTRLPTRAPATSNPTKSPSSRPTAQPTTPVDRTNWLELEYQQTITYYVLPDLDDTLNIAWNEDELFEMPILMNEQDLMIELTKIFGDTDYIKVISFRTGDVDLPPTIAGTSPPNALPTLAPSGRGGNPLPTVDSGGNNNVDNRTDGPGGMSQAVVAIISSLIVLFTVFAVAGFLFYRLKRDEKYRYGRNSYDGESRELEEAQEGTIEFQNSPAFGSHHYVYNRGFPANTVYDTNAPARDSGGVQNSGVYGTTDGDHRSRSDNDVDHKRPGHVSKWKNSIFTSNSPSSRGGAFPHHHAPGSRGRPRPHSKPPKAPKPKSSYSRDARRAPVDYLRPQDVIHNRAMSAVQSDITGLSDRASFDEDVNDVAYGQSSTSLASRSAGGTPPESGSGDFRDHKYPSNDMYVLSSPRSRGKPSLSPMQPHLSTSQTEDLAESLSPVHIPETFDNDVTLFQEPRSSVDRRGNHQRGSDEGGSTEDLDYSNGASVSVANQTSSSSSHRNLQDQHRLSIRSSTQTLNYEYETDHDDELHHDDDGYRQNRPDNDDYDDDTETEGFGIPADDPESSQRLSLAGFNLKIQHLE